MNVPLLREVKRAILANPEAFRMDIWTCGTAHCIAGWALLLRDIPIENPDDSNFLQRTVSGELPQDVAADLLGIERNDSCALFNLYYWPGRFQSAYRCAADRPARASIAAERIDHFIATDGAE